MRTRLPARHCPRLLATWTACLAVLTGLPACDRDEPAGADGASAATGSDPSTLAPSKPPADTSRDLDDPPIVLPPLDAEEHALGLAEVDDVRVKAFQQGSVGTTGFLVIRVSRDMTDGIVRAWLGDEAATGTVKTKLFYRSHDRMFSGQASGPDPLPADARWWVELDPPDGPRVRFAFDPVR